jgi:hypothetical protein
MNFFLLPVVLIFIQIRIKTRCETAKKKGGAAQKQAPKVKFFLPQDSQASAPREPNVITFFLE